MGGHKLILVCGFITLLVSLSTQNTTEVSTSPTPPPTTGSSTTQAPTPQPTTGSPTTQAPTPKPTTGSPTTQAPTPKPTTGSPTTQAPTPQPTTGSPTTAPPATDLHLNTYTYKDDKNVSCLLVKMTAWFEDKLNNVTINVTERAKVDLSKSSCSKLVVNMDGKNMFTFMFGEDNKNSSYYLETVTAALNGETHAVANLTTGKATMKASYKCESGIDIALSKNVTMHTMHVQFQAYQLDQDKFGTAQICTGDIDKNIVVPIAVGCALAGLIIIVIVAYLIGRRRMKHRYEAM